MAALATMVLPRSVASTSAASWVATVSPAKYLRADFASRARNCAPAGWRISSHASSTTTERGRRRLGSLMRRQVASNASRVPMVRNSSGRSRNDHTVNAPEGSCVLAPSSSPANAPPATKGASPAARSTATGSAVAAS